MAIGFTQKYKIINPKKRMATRLIDFCLSPWFTIARGLGYQHGIRNKPIDLKSLKKILIIRTAYIGDVIMTLPMLQPLKRACPQAEITMLVPTGAAPLLENHPYVDKVIPYNAFWFYKQRRQSSPLEEYVNDLGLDSLDTVQLVLELEEQFGKESRNLDSREIKKYIDKRVQEISDGREKLESFKLYYPGKADYKNVIQHIQSEKYDLVIDARGDIRDIYFLVYRSHAKYRVSYGFGGGSYFLTHVVPYTELIHKVDAHLDLLRYLGIQVLQEDQKLEIFLTDEEKRKAKEKLRELGIQDSDTVIGIHPGGRKPLKSWQPEKYAQLADKISSNSKTKILVTGTEDEKPIIDQMVKNMTQNPMVLAGKTNIRELAAIISQCAMFITNDSAPMHISAAVGTPSLAIFGPSKSIETSPYGKGHQIVENDYPCRWTCDEDKCYHIEYHGCIKSIEVEQVLQTALELINTDIEAKKVRT